MTAAAALLLVTHGLLHLAVWLPRPSATAPFDPQHSWLVVDAAVASGAAIALSCATAALDAAAGVGLAIGGPWEPAAVLGASTGLALKVAWFHPWLLAGVAIDVAVLGVVLS